MKKFFLIFLLFFSFFSGYINYSVYKSFKAQALLRLDKENLSYSSNYVDNLLPSIPNVDVAAMPLDVYKVPYYLNENRISEALDLAINSDKINPYTKVGSLFRARIYLFAGDIDSALVYAKDAYFSWPKNQEHYKVLNEVLVAKLDTTFIKTVFSHADSLYPTNSFYKREYEKSLNTARAGYIISLYLDESLIIKDSLIGQWQRVYEYSNGSVLYDPNTVLSFSNDNVFKDTKGSDYLYELKGDTLKLKFRANGFNIKDLLLLYSKNNQTLILKDIGDLSIKDQYFKKISSNSVKQ